MGRNGFAVVDLETTGLSNQDRIVEIGVVLLRPDFSVERTWETLIQPERDIPNSYIHKITATDVVDAPSFCDVAPYLGSLLNGRTLVAHNASFEHRFLTNEFARAGAEDGLCEWLDTMRLTKQYMGVGKLSEALGIAKIRNRFAHSALADAEATAELLRYLCVGNGVDVEKYPTATFTAPAAEAPCLPRGGEPSWAGQLSRTLPTATTKHEADYRAELTCALVDRAISRTEMRRLESTAIAAGLSADDVDAINEEFTRQLAVEAWADGVITDEERATLLDIAEALNVDAQLVRSLLDEPTSGPTPATFALRPGDRVAFTGPSTSHAMYGPTAPPPPSTPSAPWNTPPSLLTGQSSSKPTTASAGTPTPVAPKTPRTSPHSETSTTSAQPSLTPPNVSDTQASGSSPESCRNKPPNASPGGTHSPKTNGHSPKSAPTPSGDSNSPTPSAPTGPPTP